MILCLACSVVVGEGEVPHIVGRWRVHREISILEGRETERERLGKDAVRRKRALLAKFLLQYRDLE